MGGVLLARGGGGISEGLFVWRCSRGLGIIKQASRPTSTSILHARLLLSSLGLGSKGQVYVYSIRRVVVPEHGGAALYNTISSCSGTGLEIEQFDKAARQWYDAFITILKEQRNR